jgi:hypothetical protein
MVSLRGFEYLQRMACVLPEALTSRPHRGGTRLAMVVKHVKGDSNQTCCLQYSHDYRND